MEDAECCAPRTERPPRLPTGTTGGSEFTAIPVIVSPATDTTSLVRCGLHLAPLAYLDEESLAATHPLAFRFHRTHFNSTTPVAPMTDNQLDIFGMRQSVSGEELLTLRKRELRNLLTSYADEADVFSEIIQNALDAILLAHEHGLYDEVSHARLDIVIGRRADDPDYLLVSDNGVGMSPAVASRFTMPGFTRDKSLGRTLGYKGVGASFFFAAANNIAFQTEDAHGNRTTAAVKGSFRWIMSTSEPPPTPTTSFVWPRNVRSLLPTSRGTAVYYEFHPDLKPRNLSHIVRLHNEDPFRELRHWASYLCAKTAVGYLDNVQDVPLTIGLHLDRGDESHSTQWSLGSFNLDDRQLGYPYPWAVLKVHHDLADIEALRKAQQGFEHKAKHQALRLHWTRDELLGLSKLHFTRDEEQLVTEHFKFLDVFFAYSTDILDAIHKRTGSRAKVLRYGIRLACDGVPQGRIIDFDLTRHQGLARQAHAVIAFEGLELDTGRKIPANELVMSVVRKITVRAMTHLATYRWALKNRSRPDPSSNLDGWRSDTKERTSQSIVRRMFLALGQRSPISVDPGTENDVIALFAALLAREVLLGYEIVALSGFNRYDGLVNILTDTGELTDDVDPFSVRYFEHQRGGNHRILEFKLSFDSVLEDFESGDKRPQDIDLLVCWTLPDIKVNRGTIRYTYGDRNDFRETYGMTHLWLDAEVSSSIPIICLKHFITEKLKLLESDAGKPGVGTSRFVQLLDDEKLASL